MTEENPKIVKSEQTELPPKKIAFVIDGEVVDILHTDERLHAIFLSNPKLIDVTEKISNGQLINPGYHYDENTNTFSDPLESDE